MARLLFWLLIGALAWALLKPRRRMHDAGAGRPGRGPAPQAEMMVPCARCGVRLPRTEALAGTPDDTFYCSEAHRQAGPSA